MLLTIMEHAGKFYLGHLGKVPVYASVEAFFLIFFVFLIGQNLSGDQIVMLLVVLVLIILLHELGHALVALALGMSGVAITLSALGGYCSYSGVRYPKKELLISAAGPGMNFILAGATFAVMKNVSITDESISFFVNAFFGWNLVLGIFNSLPIYPLDGGQMALSISRMLTNEYKAKRATLNISFISAFAALAIYIGVFNGAPSLFTFAIIAMLLFAAYRELR